jgi:hypothetical protein
MRRTLAFLSMATAATMTIGAALADDTTTSTAPATPAKTGVGGKMKNGVEAVGKDTENGVKKIGHGTETVFKDTGKGIKKIGTGTGHAIMKVVPHKKKAPAASTTTTTTTTTP